MKLYFHLLATLTLVKVNGFDNTNFPTCGTAGGPRGSSFDDAKFVGAGYKLASIKLCSGHRVDGLGVTIISPDNKKQEPFHGSMKNCQVSDLGPNDQIISFEVHTAQHNKQTRIGFVKFTNEAGNIIEAGRMTKDENRISGCVAPNGYHLAGFFGREGDEIDALAPIWVPIKAV